MGYIYVPPGLSPEEINAWALEQAGIVVTETVGAAIKTTRNPFVAVGAALVVGAIVFTAIYQYRKRQKSAESTQ